MANVGGEGSAWQREADLLAYGRARLERLCNTTRYRHLFPEGPSLALLLAAYQDLQRQRLVGRLAPDNLRRARRFLRRQLRDRVRDEAVERSLRLTYRIPVARPRPLFAALPPLVERALEAVDEDIRDRVRDHVRGLEIPPEPDPDRRFERGLGQLRDAIIFQALGHPDEIGALHPQIVRLAASPLPTRRQHPVARFIFIKLPVYFWLGFIGLFSVAYVAAYFFLNDAALGRLLTRVIDAQINGRLELGSVHWRPDLILDLVTGSPHHATVTGLKIWTGYKKQGLDEPETLIAACDGPIDADLVLHEIIPWNRFLVPAVLEVPWVLHFTDIRTEAPMRLDVTEVEAHYADGTSAWVVDLVEAFGPGPGPYPELSTRALSIRIDHTDLASLDLNLDFRPQTGWQTELDLRDVGAVLVFEGLHPKRPPPPKKPLQFDLDALAVTGVARISLLGYEFPLQDLKIERFASGGDGPLGDIRFLAEGMVGGSHGRLRGWLRDIFNPVARSVDVTALFDDAGPLGRIVTRAHGLADPMIDAGGAPALMSFRGPFSDIRIGLAASGVGFNFFTDPSVDWAITDAAVDLTLARDPVPEQWSHYLAAGEERWLVDLTRFEGHVLGGSFRLREHAARNHLVLGTGPERRLLMAAQTELHDVDPGELVAAGDTRAMLAGAAAGDLDVRELVLDLGPAEATPEGPAQSVPSTSPADVTGADAPAAPPPRAGRKTRPKARGAAAEPVADAVADAATAAPPPAASSPLERIVLELGALKIERRRGGDGLPRRLRLDGGIILDREEGLDLADLLITVDGATLAIDGGLDPTFAVLKPTDLRLKITDGHSFFAAIGQTPFVERLTAGLTVYGPLGRPSGRNGSLQLSDLGQGQFAVQNIRDVAFGLHDGVLTLESPRATVLGGAGALDVAVGLFDGKGLSADPTLRATIDLTGVDLTRIGGDSIGGRGDVRLEIGDDGKQPVPLSQFQARGAAFVPVLTVGHGELRDTETRFTITRDGVTIDDFVARQHRAPSPASAPGFTIPVGDLRGQGSVSFDSDPKLDLVVTGRRLPVSTFAAIAGFTDLPAGAQIEPGTRLDVTGTLARPSVHGTVELSAINAVGIPLGSGQLELDSHDRPAGDGLIARREIVVKGRFGDDGGRKRRAPYEWEVDAVVAIGEKPRGSKAPTYAADLAVRFANLPLRNLLGAAGLQPGDGLHGQAEGLTLSARTCPPGQPMLSSCLWREDTSRSDLQILVELDRLWAAGRDPSSGVAAGSNQPGDPCRESDSLCSSNRLVAALHGTRLSLRDGWELRSGGAAHGKTLTVSGDVELSAPPAGAASAAAAARDCTEPPVAARRPPATGGSARLAGQLDLAGLAPFLAGTGVSSLAGKIGLDVRLDGHIGDPIISGTFDIPDARAPLTAKAAGTSFAVPKLSLQWAQDALLASGELNVRGQTLHFGDLGGHRTFYVLGGECMGNFSAAARGRIDGRLFREFLPDTFAASSGGLDVVDLNVHGRAGDVVDLRSLRARLQPAPGGLSVQLAGLGLDAVDLDEGVVELQRCSEADPCPSKQDGYGIFIGGRKASADDADPPDGAARAKIGDRGRLALWGSTVVAPDFSRVESSSMRADLDEIEYRMFDNSGRPQLHAAISGKGIVFEGRDVQALRGDILVARGRWIRDAQQGVKVLSFADPTSAPASPPPEIIRDMNLDLRLRTSTPFRVDNNVMKGVEGQVLLQLGGTIADLEMSGKIDVTAGVLDIAILNGAYDIQFGRVMLENNLASSTVDVRAQRQEPVYIDNQPRQMFVILGGTLDAITFRCIVSGDTRARSRTQRECVDYVILGSGNREVADANVRRYGSGGLLGRPLGLVGNLTEINLNRYVEKSVPRLAPYIPQVGARLGQLGIEVSAETPRPWFRSDWGNLTIGAGYTRGYPGLLLRNSYDWRIRFKLLDTAALEFRDNRRSYFNERIIFDPLRQRSLELRFDYQLPSLR